MKDDEDPLLWRRMELHTAGKKIIKR